VAPVDTTAPWMHQHRWMQRIGFYDRRMADQAPVREETAYQATAYNRDTYTYQQEPSLYNINEQDHQTLRLYQERLIANKQRIKQGSSGKHVETETASFSTSRKERVVIERVNSAEAGTVVSGEATREGEVAHVEIYEEKSETKKPCAEEVRVKKVVEQDTVEAQETLRREELIDSGNTSIVDTSDRLPNDRI